MQSRGMAVSGTSSGELGSVNHAATRVVLFVDVDPDRGELHRMRRALQAQERRTAKLAIRQQRATRHAR